MIPYEDLVNALTAWRAKQGLAVPGAAMPASSSGRYGAPEIRTSPGIGALPEDAVDVDDSLIAESAYAEDFDNQGEATAIGSPPSRPSDSFGGATDIEPQVTAKKGKGKKRDAW